MRLGNFETERVYTEKHLKSAPPVQTTAHQMACSALLLLPMTLFFDPTAHLNSYSLKTVVILFGISIFGSGMAWILYYRLLRKIDVTYISISALFIPIMGVFWGYFFLSEPLTWNKILGTGVVLSSLLLLNRNWLHLLKS